MNTDEFEEHIKSSIMQFYDYLNDVESMSWSTCDRYEHAEIFTNIRLAHERLLGWLNSFNCEKMLNQSRETEVEDDE